MAKGKKRRGKPPESTDEVVKPPPHPVGRSGFPVLSLSRCVPGFGVEEMTANQRSEFLLKWHKRSQFSWTDLRTHPRHGLGAEKMPLSKIRPACPEFLEDEEHVQVYRHEGNLPFAGIRAADVFYVIWIETEYGNLYNHG